MRLNQVIAIEKGIKSRVYGDITKMHKACQKPVLFEGQVRNYEPKTENDEALPAEKTKVQMSTSQMLKQTEEKLLNKVLKLTRAVKMAREEANSLKIEEQQTPGEKVLGWLLGQ